MPSTFSWVSSVCVACVIGETLSGADLEVSTGESAGLVAELFVALFAELFVPASAEVFSVELSSCEGVFVVPFSLALASAELFSAELVTVSCASGFTANAGREGVKDCACVPTGANVPSARQRAPRGSVKTSITN